MMHRMSGTIMRIFMISAVLILSGCFGTGLSFDDPEVSDNWGAYQADQVQRIDASALENWWERFNDPVLNKLVTLALADSPDRRIAEARILEARGQRRSNAGVLLPKLDVIANGGRQDNAINPTDNFYEAGFDASYEIDVFGKNRNVVEASDQAVESLEAAYQDVTLFLIGEISRDYVEYRAFQKQTQIALKNLNIQIKTLELVQTQKQFGEAPQLDVERAENLVNTTKASISEFKRQADNARLRLSVLTGHMPETLKPFLMIDAGIMQSDVAPVLLSPSEVISLRPDIRAAQVKLREANSLADAAAADLFPSFSLSGFFGVSDNALVNTASIWNVTLGTALRVIDFGRIRGRIDSAEAVELQAYELYRRIILEAVSEVETALSDYARMNEQYIHLKNAYDNAEKALKLSRLLYTEGEIAFINVLEAQRTLNDADSALISSMAVKNQSLIRLYKSLGVY